VWKGNTSETKVVDFHGEYSETCSRRAAVNQEQQAAIKAPAKWCEIEQSRAKEIAAT
jgi:hypothetical protein